MSEEEKEAEANKLINLIDDMHRKGNKCWAFLPRVVRPCTDNLTGLSAGVIKPGNVGPDGKVIEMDIAEQIARIPDQPESSGMK